MRRHKAVDRLQNLALLLLTLSALFLLSRLMVTGSGWAGLQELLPAGPSGGRPDQTVDLGEVMPAFHLVVTGDSEYGRYTQLSADGGDLQQILPLFQEALGSATVVGAAADKTLQEALACPSLYLDLTVELPSAVVTAWLGEGDGFGRNVRAMALAAEDGESAFLYLRSEDGSIFRYNTALPVSAVTEITDSLSPNGGSFAYESNFAPLAPYTVLVAQPPEVPRVQGDLPAGYTAYNLLTALDFNAHTNARYPESDGTEVVVESPRLLRLSPDGQVTYACDGETTSALYRVPCAGESPTAAEAVQAAGNLAAVLTESTAASPLYLRSLTQSEGGYRVTFGYQVEGVSVFFPNDAPGLTVNISGTAITSFVYRCREYTAAEETESLMPSEMAVAIASLSPGSGLSVGYVDNGTEVAARWLPR